MRRFTLLGLLLVSAFAVFASLATAALGDTTPLVLPFTRGETIVGESEGRTEYKTEGLSEAIVCETSKAELSGTNWESNLPPLGKFHILFLKCRTTGGFTCTGLGEPGSGEILILGTWHLVWDEEGERFELHVATLFLVERVHFTCAIVLITTEGEVLCLDLKPEESSRRHSFHCVVPNRDSWCKEDVERRCVGLKTPLLTSSINESAPKTAEELALAFFENDRNAVAAHTL